MAPYDALLVGSLVLIVSCLALAAAIVLIAPRRRGIFWTEVGRRD